MRSLWKKRRKSTTELRCWHIFLSVSPIIRHLGTNCFCSPDAIHVLEKESILSLYSGDCYFALHSFLFLGIHCPVVMQGKQNVHDGKILWLKAQAIAEHLEVPPSFQLFKRVEDISNRGMMENGEHTAAVPGCPLSSDRFECLSKMNLRQFIF